MSLEVRPPAIADQLSAPISLRPDDESQSWADTAALALAARAAALDAANDAPPDLDVLKLSGAARITAEAVLAHMEDPEAYSPRGLISADAAERAVLGALHAAQGAATLRAARAHRLPFPPQGAAPAADSVTLAAALLSIPRELPPAPRRGRTMDALEAHARACMANPSAPLAVLLRAWRWCPTETPPSPEVIAGFLRGVRRYVLLQFAGWPVSAEADWYPRKIAAAALRALGHDPRPFDAAARKQRARGTRARLDLAKRAARERGPVPVSATRPA